MELGRDKAVAQIISRLKTVTPDEGAVKVEGTWGSFAPILATHLFKELKRPILYIRPHIDDADKAADDLHTFSSEKIEPFAAWEAAEDLADATDEIRADRLRVTLKLISGGEKFIIPTSVQALSQPIPKPQALRDSFFKLSVEKNMSPETIVEWLIDNGFERVDSVDLPGQFARRGGIIDIYAPLLSEKTIIEDSQPVESQENAEPIRVEFFGDIIESIREINLDTQRSSQQLDSVSIVSVISGTATEHKELFINILPAGTIIILEEPTDIQEVANVFLERSEDARGLYSWADIYKAANKFTQLHIHRFATSTDGDFIKVGVKSVQQFQHKATSLWAGSKMALGQLLEETDQGKIVHLYCERAAEIKRVTEIITQTRDKVPTNFKLLLGFIHQGFVIDSLNTIVISHHELFGQ